MQPERYPVPVFPSSAAVHLETCAYMGIDVCTQDPAYYHAREDEQLIFTSCFNFFGGMSTADAED